MMTNVENDVLGTASNVEEEATRSSGDLMGDFEQSLLPSTLQHLAEESAEIVKSDAEADLFGDFHQLAAENGNDLIHTNGTQLTSEINIFGGNKDISPQGRLESHSRNIDSINLPTSTGESGINNTNPDVYLNGDTGNFQTKPEELRIGANVMVQSDGYQDGSKNLSIPEARGDADKDEFDGFTSSTVGDPVAPEYGLQQYAVLGSEKEGAPKAASIVDIASALAAESYIRRNELPVNTPSENAVYSGTTSDQNPENNSSCGLDSVTMYNSDVVSGQTTNDFADVATTTALTNIAPGSKNEIPLTGSESDPAHPAQIANENEICDFDAAPSDSGTVVATNEPPLGVVDNLLSQTASTDDDVEFGEFDTGPATSGGAIDITNGRSSEGRRNEVESAQPKILDHDEGFGDCGTAPENSEAMDMTNGLSSEEIKNETSINKDFGGFGMGLTDSDDVDLANGTQLEVDNKESECGLEPSQPQIIDDEEEFGDFDTAPECSEAMDMTNGHPSEEIKNETGNADFGDFDVALSASEAADLANGTQLEDIKKESECRLEPSQPPIIDDEEDFGDFDIAPGHSEAVHMPNATSSREWRNEPVPVTSTSDDEDFGDFDTAPVVDSEDATVFNISQLADSKLDQGQRANLDENDDFGDFGMASADGQVAVQAAIVGEKGNSGAFGNEPLDAQITVQSINLDGEDDFGAFDTAPTDSETAAQNANADEEDDFGDFDTAPVESQTFQSPSVAGEDDFGDFDIAPFESAGPCLSGEIPNSGQDAENDEGRQESDDDFGGFDTVPVDTAKTSSNRNTLEEQANGAEQDDDDDFGDFGDGAVHLVNSESADNSTAAHTSIDGDFRDFGSAEEDKSRRSNPSMHTTSSNPEGQSVGNAELKDAVPIEDTVSRKIRTGFAPLFSRYKSGKEISTLPIRSRSRSDEKKRLESIKEFMDCLPEGITEPDSNQTSLVEMLNGTKLVRKESKVVVRNQGKGSYEHLRYPLHGWQTYSESNIRRQSRAVKGSDSSLPDVLPIRLPSVDDMPVDMASPTSSPRHESKLKSEDKGLPLPPNLHCESTDENQTGGNENANTDHVKEFLQKIPDLSFMLSSTVTR